jgi:hypothetical protein
MTVYDEMNERARLLKRQVRNREITLDEATGELFAFITNNRIEITRAGAERMVNPEPMPSMGDDSRRWT